MPGDCKHNFTGETHQKHGKVSSGTVTSHRSRVRTEAEMGESGKLVAWVASCHETIQNESSAFQKLKNHKSLTNFARVLSIQVVTVFWLSNQH